LKIKDSTFVGNIARYTAGGVYVGDYSVLYLDTTTFTNNSALYGGGGLAVESSEGWVRDCEFRSNTAPNGGGLFADSIHVTLFVYTSYFHRNFATNTGGAVCVTSNARMLLDNCNITENLAFTGGGVAAFANGHVILQNANVSDNSANLGGGLYLEDQAQLYGTASTLSDNYANVGDSIYCLHSLVQLNETTVRPYSSRSAEPNGVYCAAIPTYTWCTFKITNSGNWTDTCVEPDHPLPGPSSGGGLDSLETWQIVLISVGVLFGAVSLGFAAAIIISRMFNRPVFSLLPTTSPDEPSVNADEPSVNAAISEEEEPQHSIE